MDAKHFDALARALTTGGTRRSLVTLLATLPVVGGLLAWLDSNDADAGGKHKRRVKKHKHGRGRRRKHGKKCKPAAQSVTCAGKCGQVMNNCKKLVDCGSCDCNPACPECETCQGTPGVCVPQQAGTACGAAATCTGGNLTPGGSCDGSGHCLPGTTISCAPYTKCNSAGDSCVETCADNNDCVPGSFCNGDNRCVGDLPNGETCDGAADCLSGFCVDGVCCETACSTHCLACNVAGHLGECVADPGDQGDPCGDDGQVCLADGSCACQTGTCPGNAPVCVSGSCTACSASHPCETGCCAADGTCPATCGLGQGCVSGMCTDLACGAGGLCRVFVTSTHQRSSEINGLAGADAICQARATTGGLPGTYMAWLSDGTGSPSTRFPLRGNNAAGTYVLVGTNWSVVAANWSDLTARSTCVVGTQGACLTTGIANTEMGTRIQSDASTWTNTTIGGTSAAGNVCENWTSNFGSALSGTASAPDAIWTEREPFGCVSQLRLYCFQQG